MSVLAIFRWRGDPDSLIAAVDNELEHPVARNRPRRQLHLRARANDGLVIVDVWDSREDLDAMVNDPEFLKNRQTSGTPAPDSLEVYEVHATIPGPPAA